MCQISLRIIYDSGGESLTDPQTFPFGETMRDPAEVENRLRRAQYAVLNFYANDQDPEKFLEEAVDFGALAPLGFSRNVVHLKVSGPDLVDVTFIDLPGIIANANQVCGTISDVANVYRSG